MADFLSNDTLYIQTSTGTVHVSESCSVLRRRGQASPTAVPAGWVQERMQDGAQFKMCKRCAAD